MRRLGAAAGVALVALLAACGSTTVNTPIHAANVFVDGINHADLRQACSVVSPRLGGGAVACEQSLVTAVAQASFFGEWGGYAVVAHSEKVDGDRATVEITYRPTGGHRITVGLVRTRGRWLIVSIG